MCAQAEPVRVFCSYSHRDEDFRRALEAHLAPLRRRGNVEIWSDYRIRPGERWDEVIQHQLRMADVFLLLVSADFLNSDYCYEREFRNALERHHRGEIQVVPVIVRDCAWEATELGSLQVLPRGGKPVGSWPNSDEAWTAVARDLADFIRSTTPAPKISASKTVQDLQEDLARAYLEPLTKHTCRWQVKESQVLLGRRDPDPVGYYPVLVGFQNLVSHFNLQTKSLREQIVSWSLSTEAFDATSDWFLHQGAAIDPADPPILDIRHTAEVGIVLLMDGRAEQRAQRIVNNVLEKQGNSCSPGAWKSTDGSATEDPMSTVICTELVARAADCEATGGESSRRLQESLSAAFAFLNQTKRPRGWSYEGLTESFWEVWGASIVAFRLGQWLPSDLRGHAVDCIVSELRRTDALLGVCDSVQRPRLLARLLCGLDGVRWNSHERRGWEAIATRCWLELHPSERDISTRLHLSYLFPPPKEQRG